MPAPTVYRGTVIKFESGQPLVEVPALGVGYLIGPCETTTGIVLQPGARVLCVSVSGIPEYVVVVGELDPAEVTLRIDHDQLRADHEDLDTRHTTTRNRVDAIESGLNGAGGAANLNTRLNNVENRVTTVEGRATTLEGRATTLEGRATAVEGRATALESRVLTTTASVNFASMATGATNEQTVTLTGAVTGDAVMLGPPAGLEAGLLVQGRVTASNTVTLRAFNLSGATLDPAAATWRVTVTRATGQ
jgi:hypothetical protein